MREEFKFEIQTHIRRHIVIMLVLDTSVVRQS